MKKKKLYLIVFVLIFTLSSFISVFADSNVSEDEAKKIVINTLSKYFDTTIDEQKFLEDIFDHEEYRNKLVWTVILIGDQEKGTNIVATVDCETKKVVEVSIEEESEKDKYKEIKITKEQAREISDNFLNKINPNEIKNTRLKYDAYVTKDGDYIKNYTFVHRRAVNGIDFDDDGISVEVDASTGEITRYRISWHDNLNVPDVKTVIDANKAKKLVSDTIDMKLSYMGIDKNYDDNAEEIKLVYNPHFLKTNLVDAEKGEVIDYTEELEEIKTKYISKEEKEKISKNIVISSSQLNKEQAKGVINNKLKELLNSEFEIEDVLPLNDENNTDKVNTWQAKFTYKNSNGKKVDGKIEIDAFNKELIYIDNGYDGWEEGIFKPNFTWEEGYDAVLDMLSKYCPSKAININTKKVYDETDYEDEYKSKMQDKTYWYRFSRTIDGIDYNYNYIEVGLDSKTKELKSLWFNWDDTEFLSKDKAMLQQKAKDIYLKNNKVRLCYVSIYDQKLDKEEIALVYKFEEVVGFEEIVNIDCIDAVDGKLLDYNGEEIKK